MRCAVSFWCLQKTQAYPEVCRGFLQVSTFVQIAERIAQLGSEYSPIPDRCEKAGIGSDPFPQRPYPRNRFPPHPQRNTLKNPKN